MSRRKRLGTSDDLRGEDQLQPFSNDETVDPGAGGPAVRFGSVAVAQSNFSSPAAANDPPAAIVSAAGAAVAVPAPASAPAVTDDVAVAANDDVAVAATVVTDPAPGDDLQVQLQQAASLMRLADVRANPLYAGVDGHGQTVVILDTGIDLDHPFFGPDANSNGIADRILFQYDFYGGNDSNASDAHGHGTHVAGIIGSQNSMYPGVAPGSNFIILKVLSDRGSGNFFDIEEAFQWVVANRNAYNIVAVSMSIGDSANVNLDLNTNIANEVQTLWNSGIATVIAAGNSYASYGTPGVNGLAATTLAWGVASTLDNANTFSWFSQRSATMTEIAAPGSNITSAYLNGGIATMSGTSMATPMISGLVALAQDLSQQVTGGTRLAPATLLNIMRSTGVSVTDGTTTVPRADALNLLNGIVAYWQQSTANADNVYGWRGDDVLSGLNGDDNIYGNGGNDTIDGGENTDTAIFTGARSQYQITTLSSNSRRVADQRTGSPDGIDTVSNVEFFQFTDRTYSFAELTVDVASDVAGSVSIDDQTISEGDSGTRVATFTVTRSGGTAAFDVNFATSDGDAASGDGATVADNDYVVESGTLQFAAHENARTISVTINGDTLFESDQAFFVNLSGGTNGATISDSLGTGLITNDDPMPQLQFLGSAENDTLVGNAADNEMDGLGGDDVLFGGDGRDDLRGGDGDDLLYGGAGNDLFVGGAGRDAFTGGGGDDEAAYQTSTSGVSVNLVTGVGTGDAAGDTFGSIESLIGSAFDDFLSGDNADNFLYGLDGNDNLRGEAGDDLLIGGAGADAHSGGDGTDTVSYHNAADSIRVVLFQSRGQCHDAEGDTFGSIENIVGSQFSDEIFGDSAANVLTGLGGHDTLEGDAGNDTLDGGDGSDKLYGQDGDDTLIGGAGQDRLFGGGGADRFVFISTSDSIVGAEDEVVEFTRQHGDLIDLTQIDANTGVSGDQAFSFIGTTAFNGTAGQLHYVGGRFLEGDVDGNGTADFRIQFNNSELQTSDFLL